MNFDIFDVTREAMINSALQNLLVNNSKKLPTKTLLAQEVNTNVHKLKLVNISIIDLIVKQLINFEKEISGIFNFVKQKSSELSTSDKIELFFKQTLTLLVKNKNLSHLLSNNNLYGLSEVIEFNRQFNINVYLNIRNVLLSDIKSIKINTVIAQMLLDTLQGLFLTLSNNIDLTNEITDDYLVQISFINNLLKAK